MLFVSAQVFFWGRLSSSYFLRRLRLSLLLYRLHALPTQVSEYYTEIGDSRPHATAAGDSAMPGPRRGHWGDRGIPLFAPRFLFVGYLLFGRAFLLGGLEIEIFQKPTCA